MPAQPKLTLITRQHRVIAFLGIAGLIATAILTVVGVSTSARGSEIKCGSPFSPLNNQDISDALNCGMALDVRRMLALVAFAASIIVLTMFTCAILAPPRSRQVVPTRGRHVTVRNPRPKDASQVQATIDAVVIAEMGWTAVESESWATSVRLGSVSGALVVVDDMTQSIGGIVTLTLDTTMTNSLLLGFWAGPGHRGRGLMSDAVRAVADDLIENDKSVRAETAVSNIAAQRVIEQAGLMLAGRRTVRLPNGTFADGLIYTRYADGAQPPSFDPGLGHLTRPPSNQPVPPGNGAWGPPAV